MKRNLIFVLMLLTATANAQDWSRELGMSYFNANPTGTMGRIIDRAHGVEMNYALGTPDNRFAFGINFSFAQYGRDKSRQEYTLDDGSTAPMDIIVANSFFNPAVFARWNVMTKGVIRPYVLMKTGYSVYTTTLNIYDPDDRDHCEPVDSDDLYNDGAFFASLGAGVRFDMSKIFGRLNSERLFLNMNYSVSQGGTVSYMNADIEGTNHHTPIPNADLITAEFLNTQTQVVHEHHVGNLYRSSIQMTELTVGLTLNLNR
jgi:hypothetical protein